MGPILKQPVPIAVLVHRAGDGPGLRPCHQTGVHGVHTPCSVQCAVCSVQRAACRVQRAVCSMQRAACSVQRAEATSLNDKRRMRIATSLRMRMAGNMR